MKSDDCELKKECMEFLCEFPDRVPYRCRLCTPMVKYTLERIRDMHKDKNESLGGEIDQWRANGYDD